AAPAHRRKRVRVREPRALGLRGARTGPAHVHQAQLPLVRPGEHEREPRGIDADPLPIGVGPGPPIGPRWRPRRRTAPVAPPPGPATPRRGAHWSTMTDRVQGR